MSDAKRVTLSAGRVVELGVAGNEPTESRCVTREWHRIATRAKREEIKRLREQLADAEAETKQAHEAAFKMQAECNVAVDHLQAEIERLQKDLNNYENAACHLSNSLAEAESRVRVEVAAMVRELKRWVEISDGFSRAATARELQDLLDTLEPQKMTFAEAMAAVADGKRVRQQGWGTSYLVMRNGTVTWGLGTTWIVRPCDIDATDWVVESEGGND